MYNSSKGISLVIMMIAIGNGLKTQVNAELDEMAGGVAFLQVNQGQGEQEPIFFREEDFV